MNKEELIKIFINGPLQKYLTGDISYGRFIELINEECGTNFRYGNLYPSYLFNAKLQHPDIDEHNSNCNWYSDWHSCNCGAFDKDKK